MKSAIFGLCFFIVGVFILNNGIRDLKMDYKAKSWPTTEGTIISSKCVDYSDFDNGSSYFTHVDYRYTVAGKSYQGDRIAFSYTNSWWRRPHQKIADKLSAAKTVLVRYDPDKPSTAALSYGLNASAVRTLFIGTWLLLLTALVLLQAAYSRDTSGFLSLSWGLKGFNIITQGFGGIVLFIITGWGIAILLSFMIDFGILGKLVTH